jgi:DMSO/TMAO reductase YedYZ molybdopterin-dependent catalytic subunit
VGLAAVGLALPVAGARALAARTGLPGALEAALGGIGVAALAALVAGPTAAAAGAGVAAAAVAALPHAPGVRRPGRAADGRRRALAGLAGLLGVGVVGYATGAGRAGGESGADEEAALDPAVTEKLELAGERSLGIEGIEPLVSREFYNVDINSVDPTLETDGWSLSVTGAVEEPYSIDYETLTSRDSREEFVTLRCVGEGINGKKLDNALWTVVDAMPILEAAGLPDECCVMARAADDFYEEFPLAAMEDAMLAYRMNGRPLPRAHGRPVRLLVPGHWGEINVKWIDEIEILEEPAEGYWEKRGWHGTGPVNTVAKLHATNVRDDGTIEVGGHAYAGVRGIERVEVSTDGGESWTDAELSERLPGIDVWRQWRHVYEADGEHEVVVRATDGEGTLQPEKRQQAYPSGATGWVSETVRP